MIGIGVGIDSLMLDGNNSEVQVISSLSPATNSFWLRADRGLVASGGSVLTWEDYLTSVLPGHIAHNGGDDGGAYRPTLGALENGYPAVVFDGGNRHMSLSGPDSASGSHTWGLVFDCTGTTGYQILFSEYSGGICPEIATGAATNGLFYVGVSHTTIPGANLLTDLQSLVWVYDTVAGICTLYRNGLAAGVLTAGVTAKVWSFNSLGRGADGPLNMKMASVCYENRADYNLPAALHRWARRMCGTPEWYSLSIPDDGQVDSIADFRSSLSQRAVLATNARKCIVEFHPDTYASLTSYSDVTVDRNGVKALVGQASAVAVTQKYVALAGGAQTLTVRDGPAHGAMDSDVKRTWVSRLLSEQPLSLVAAPAAPANRLVVMGDSISVGCGATDASNDAWAHLLRGLLGATWRVNLSASRGSYGLFAHSTASPNRQDLAQQLASCCDGTATNVIWLCMGYNDFTAGYSPSLYATHYADLLDRIHALVPDAIVCAQSPITATVEELTNPTRSLPLIRTAIVTACTGREAWCTYVDGTTITATLVDGIHPSTAGHATYAADVAGILTT